MLEDMNINPKDVLPEGTIIDFKVKDFKQLSDSEIIKIQKFFIKKLV
jgi:predicted Holliday junction resolvase-like endonuclease